VVDKFARVVLDNLFMAFSKSLTSHALRGVSGENHERTARNAKYAKFLQGFLTCLCGWCKGGDLGSLRGSTFDFEKAICLNNNLLDGCPAE
jgi:hypothetical protein